MNSEFPESKHATVHKQRGLLHSILPPIASKFFTFLSASREQFKLKQLPRSFVISQAMLFLLTCGLSFTLVYYRLIVRRFPNLADNLNWTDLNTYIRVLQALNAGDIAILTLTFAGYFLFLTVSILIFARQFIRMQKIKAVAKETKSLLLTKIAAKDKHFEAFCRICPIGFFLFNADGMSIYSNNTLKALIEIKNSGFTLVDITNALHPDDRLEFSSAWDEMTRTSDKLTIEHRLLRADEEIIWIKTHIVTLKESGELIGYLGFIQDINTIRSLQSSLSEKEIENQMLRALGTNGSKALSLVLPAETAKIISRVTYEIKRDLATIAGLGEVLADLKQSEFVNRKNLRTLRRLTSELMEKASLIESAGSTGDLSMNEECPLQSLFEILMARWQGRFAEKGLSVGLERIGTVPNSLPYSQKQVTEVLDSLIEHALESMTSGGVKITCRLAKSQECLLIEVIDTGSGYEQDEIPSLLGLSNTDQETSDLLSPQEKENHPNLLHKARLMAEAFGGVLTYESIIGRGSVSTLVVRLDREQVSPRRSMEAHSRIADKSDSTLQADEIEAPTLEGKILLVDRPGPSQEVMSRMLAGCGLQVETVDNGRDGIDAALTNRFDVILIDTDLPILDGETTIKILRNCGFRVPIVALGIFDRKNSRNHFQSLGCEAVISKPCTMASLARSLEPFVSSAHFPANGKSAKRKAGLFDSLSALNSKWSEFFKLKL